MKIGIVTFHFPWNCGAALQCVALQTYLEKIGHEAQVIDYRPLYHVNRYSEYKHPVYLARKAAVRKSPNEGKVPRVKRAATAYVNTVKSWRKHDQVAPQAKRFRDFAGRHMHLTSMYRTVDKLRSNPPDCDLYVSGSDQLWNAKLTGGKFDPAYFLDFGPDDAGRITFSVGADFAAVKFPQSKLIKYVGKLDSISLRETRCLETVRGACEYIGQGDKPIHIDLDPTFLLEREDYEQFEDSVDVPEDYIFVYTMPNPQSQSIANKVALALGKEKGLPVIDACGNPVQGNRTVPDHRVCGPGEFLSYVKNATYVVTSSFHGTALSVIYGKEFVAIPHTDTGNRVTELLDKLGLSTRYHDNAKGALAAFADKVDYATCYDNLQGLREESRTYLKECAQRFGRGASAE